MPALFAQVKESVIGLIVSGRLQPGEVLPPVEYLAERANCSVGTVRRALAELASAGIVKGVRRKGTVVAKLPTAGRVCLLLSPDSHTNLIFQDAVYWALSRAGFHVDLVPPTKDVGEVMARCRQLREGPERSDCVVAFDPMLEDAAGWDGFRGFLDRYPRQVVFAEDNRPRFPRAHLITIDHHQAARVVVEHFLSLGHRRVAIFAGGAPGEEGWAHDAAENCRHLLEVAGATFHPVYLPEQSETLRRLVTEEGVTAYWDIHDYAATLTAGLLRQWGRRVPQDVSLIGRHDTPWARDCRPPLTTVSYNAVGVAEAIAEALKLAEKSDGPAYARITKVAPHLEVRGSTGRAP